MRFTALKWTALLAVLFIFLLTIPVFAGNIVPSGVTAGTGGLTTKGGELAQKTVGSDYLWRWVKGTGACLATPTNAAGAGFNLFDYTATLGIMDGTDDFCVFDINLTNANQTGTCTLEVLDIAGITGDAQCTETAINIGAGWDEGINCQSPATLAFSTIVNETTATRTVTSSDFGKIIACSYAGATTVTLPDPGSSTVGATFYVTELVDQSLTIVGGSTANNNQIIADGVLTSDNVAFSTSSHKIGAMCKVTQISATKWLITNASSCAMTVEAAD